MSLTHLIKTASSYDDAVYRISNSTLPYKVTSLMLLDALLCDISNLHVNKLSPEVLSIYFLQLQSMLQSNPDVKISQLVDY